MRMYIVALLLLVSGAAQACCQEMIIQKDGLEWVFQGEVLRYPMMDNYIEFGGTPNDPDVHPADLIFMDAFNGNHSYPVDEWGIRASGGDSVFVYHGLCEFRVLKPEWGTIYHFICNTNQ